MSPDESRSIVLIGPPGAGCSSVGSAIGATEGLPVLDLALRLLDRAAAEGAVVALGSGCLSDSRLCERLEGVRLRAGHSLRVVALICATRVLATRNGLDAPRSVGLGNVHHQFVQMLQARQERCQELADLVVDTTATTPEEAGEEVVQALAQVSPCHS